MKRTLQCFSLSNLSYSNWRQGKTNMTTLGKIERFIPATGDWRQYIERMNQSKIQSCQYNYGKI